MATQTTTSPSRWWWRSRTARGRGRRTVRALAALLSVTLSAGACSPNVARLLNPEYPRCQRSLREALAITLVGQGETDEVAEKLADDTVQALAAVDLGAKPFKVTSPSGVQYGYLFEREDDRCLLRMVAWQLATVQVSDNVRYLASRPLPGCGCRQ